jgi:ferredoxin
MMAVMSETFRVTLLPGGETFPAAADQTVLLAGLAAGLQLPWSCRTGTCRTCISHLAEGRVAYRVEWPGLSYEEKAEGFILPCVAEPRSDLTITCGP